MLLFGVFVAILGQSPAEVYSLIYKGPFDTSLSWQNTPPRPAPLILTALCVALPAQAGLMVIGAEGALVLGGLAAAVVGHGLAGSAPLTIKIAMMAAGFAIRGLLVAGAGRPRPVCRGHANGSQ